MVKVEELQKRLEISQKKLREVNDVLLDPETRVVKDFLAVVSRFGTPEEINAKAKEAGKVESLMKRLETVNPSYVKDLEWLIAQRDRNAFVSVDEYRRNVLGDRVKDVVFDETLAVTLEISALQYFPWLMAEARQAMEKRELMPGRFIQVRKMKEQEEDGDLLALAAATKIMGSSLVETLDTKGTDGSNIHLGGPATITGYFGGVGQPNGNALKWVEEYLYYYTSFGIRQVLNINPGTIMLAYMLHRLGIDNEFKISVFMGNDNPYSIFWTLMAARLFSRDDGSTSLIGFNFSNSVNRETIEISAQLRGNLGLDDIVRFEHHILEAYKSIVIQPYDRRDDLLELATHVKNISAKHEGGEVATEEASDSPSDILHYFMAKEDVIKSGVWDNLQRNYLNKHDGVNNTARALTAKGLAFVAAHNLHGSVCLTTTSAGECIER